LIENLANLRGTKPLNKDFLKFLSIAQSAQMMLLLKKREESAPIRENCRSTLVLAPPQVEKALLPV